MNLHGRMGNTALNYIVGDSGIYRVVAHNGCGYDTASVHIARKTCACEITLPNAFTPNNDGRNDASAASLQYDRIPDADL